MPEAYSDLAPAVVDLLSSYLIERHIRREKQEGPNPFKKAIEASPEFIELWNRIKPKTNYRVEFKTDARNERSQKALERIGAQPEGVLRKHMIVQGDFARDSVYYSIIGSEWPKLKKRLARLLIRK